MAQMAMREITALLQHSGRFCGPAVASVGQEVRVVLIPAAPVGQVRKPVELVVIIRQVAPHQLQRLPRNEVLLAVLLVAVLPALMWSELVAMALVRERRRAGQLWQVAPAVQPVAVPATMVRMPQPMKRMVVPVVAVLVGIVLLVHPPAVKAAVTAAAVVEVRPARMELTPVPAVMGRMALLS